MHNHRLHLLQPIKELLFIIDLDGQLMECSDFVCKMLQYKEGNLKSKSFSELVYKDVVWNFNERGRGIQLARMYFDSNYFNEKGNQVSLIKKLTN